MKNCQSELRVALDLPLWMTPEMTSCFSCALQHSWTICAGNFGLVSVSRDIPGPVGLGDRLASVAIPGRPVKTSQ